MICTIKHLTNVDLEVNPAACLLHLSERPLRKYKASLTIQLLNTAKDAIEDLTATPNNREETFHDTWRPWQYFVYTEAYL